MIYIECFADEILIKSLFPFLTKREYSHLGNKSSVIKKLIKQNDGRGYIGLIDKDPGSRPPAYYNSFIKENEELDQVNIELLKAQNQARLVVITPNLEGWVINSAHFIHKRLRNYGLPDDERDLHEAFMKSKNNLILFKKLLKDIINLSPHIQKLKQIFENYHRI